jgi:UDP-glucose 4-epimerase
MKVFVTGGTGFIGRALLPALAGRGHDVVALARRVPDGKREGVLWLEGELGIGEASLPAVDAIIHLAQASVPFPQKAEEMYAVNTVSTLHLLEHARQCGAKRFMLASTGNVYGFGQRPFTEQDALRPQGFYPISKVNAENIVTGYRDFFDTALLRLFTPYGPGQAARLVPNLIQSVREGKTITLREGGRPHLTPIYIDDIVEVFCRLLEKDGQLTVNVAGDEHVSLRQIAEIAGECLGRAPVVQELDEPAAGDLTSENSFMKELTGMTRLLPVRDGIAHMV